jgi:hypothetical protein
LTPVIIIVGIIAVALTFWNGVNWYEFVTGYRYNGEFQGKRYESRLRFATSECDSLCFVGATEAALYLLYHPPQQGMVVEVWGSRLQQESRNSLERPQLPSSNKFFQEVHAV